MESLSTGKQKPTFSSSCFLTGLLLPPLHILPVINNTNELETFLPFSGRQASWSLCSPNTWNLHFLRSVLSSILHSLILCINTFPLSPFWNKQEKALSMPQLPQMSSVNVSQTGSYPRLSSVADSGMSGDICFLRAEETEALIWDPWSHHLLHISFAYTKASTWEKEKWIFL